MASVTFPQATAKSVAKEHAESIPWYVWLSVFGVTSAMIGVHWDISWHRSIGRDTFWTPAHLAIQLCGVIAGITCGYLILWTTLTNSALRASSVNVLGFRAPLGAFICAWGGFAMITSAPFDDWWHNAYGLDVKILSPPHVVLALGMLGVEIGALVLVAGQMNRATGALRKRLEFLYLYLTAMVMIALLILVMDFVARTWQHSMTFYRVVCMMIPMLLISASKATGRRWAATTVAGVYTAVLAGLTWILPLFPAQPKLGPVFHEVTQFIPGGFPLLIFVPAMVLDTLWTRTRTWGKWKLSLVSGVVFLAVFMAVQWPFADFLQSPGARNAFFGSGYLDYFSGPKSYAARYLFVPVEKTLEHAVRELGLAAVLSVFTMWLGLNAGGWLQRVRR